MGDRERFLLGVSLGPDASSHEDGSYVTAHYIKSNSDETRKGVVWTDFSKKYEKIILDDDFVLGYYCHLIMDAVWLYYMADRYVRCYPLGERDEAYKRGYRDYDKLNYLLENEYNLEKPSFNKLSNPISEISEERLLKVLDFFAKCFNQSPSKKEDLDIYKWDKVKDYILRSTSLCVSEVKALRNKTGGINSKDLFVKV